MSAVVADTHAILWFLKNNPRLSAPARAGLRHATATGQPIYVSAITFVEVAYLIDKGKLPAADWLLLGSAVSNGVKTAIELVPIGRAVAETVPLIRRAAVPDMPDRIIAATALHLGVPLVSRDRKIQASSIHTIW